MHKCKCCVNAKHDTWLTSRFTAVRLYLWEITNVMYSVFPYSSFWANLADTAIGFTGCVSLGWSTSGSVIQDHLDHSASKELMNPPLERIHQFIRCTLIWVITDPDSDHPKRRHPQSASFTWFPRHWILARTKNFSFYEYCLLAFVKKAFTFYSTGERQDLRIWPRHDCWEMQGSPQLAGGESRSK